MSDTVDNVLNTVEAAASGADEPADVVVNEETFSVNEVETTGESLVVDTTEEVVEATEDVEEETTEEVVEATEDVEEETTEEVVETTATEPVSVEEVVQNVQEILTTPVNEDLSDKERIIQLEARVGGLINLLRSVYKQREVDENEFVWVSDFNSIREKLNNV